MSKVVAETIEDQCESKRITFADRTNQIDTTVLLPTYAADNADNGVP